MDEGIMKIPLINLQVNSWLTDLRKLCTHTIYRYRKAIRAGAEFPPLTLDASTAAVISGNHRLAAYQMELDPEEEISVIYRTFESKAERIKYFVEQNASHGLPLDAFSQKKIIQALINEDVSQQEIAALLKDLYNQWRPLHGLEVREGYMEEYLGKKHNAA